MQTILDNIGKRNYVIKYLKLIVNDYFITIP
jgi:hypothetical protein